MDTFLYVLVDLVAMYDPEERIIVLAVDDEEEILKIISQYLSEDESFTVIEADSVGAALEVLAQDEISAIVSDYQMPGMNGLEFLSILREQGNQIPFILFTGRGCEEVVIQALNLGADFYIVKGEQPELQFHILKKQIKALIAKKKADEALIESERKNRIMLSQLRATLEATEEGILVTNRGGKISDFNEQFLFLWNVTAEEIQNVPIEMFFKMIAEVVPDNPLLPEILQPGDRRSSRRHTLHCIDGRVIEVYIRSQNCDDRVIGVVYSFRDITPRVRAEILLAESRERFRILFEHSPVSHMAISPDGRIIEVNRAWLSMMKRSRESVIGTPFFDIVDPNARTLFQTCIQEVLKVKLKHSAELVLRDGEDDLVIVLADGTAIRDNNGSIVQIHCVLRDITYQRKTEKRLKWTESLLYEIMSLLPFAICVTNGPHLEIVFQNKNFLSFWEPDISQVLPRKGLIPSLNDFFSALNIESSFPEGSWVFDTCKNPDVLCNEIELPGKRVVRVFKRSLACIGDDERILWAFEDITRIKDQEYEIRRYARKIEIMSRIISLSGRAGSVPLLCDLSLSALTSMLHFTGGSFYLLSDEPGLSRMVAHVGLSGDYIAETANISVYDYSFIYEEKKPLFTNSFSAINPGFAVRWGIAGAAFIPVLSGDRVLGSIHLTSSKPIPMSLEDQEILLGIGREIGSALRRLEGQEKLNEERKNQDNLINAIEDLVIVVDAHDRSILAVNEGISKKTGLFREDLIGKKTVGHISPFLSSIPIDKAIGDPVTLKHTIPLSIGNTVLMETRITSGIWNGKKALFCISHDITSTVKAQEQIRLSEERINTIFLTCPIGIMLFSPDDRMLQINPAAISILGLTNPLDLSGYSYAADPNLPDEVKDKIRSREPFSLEIVYDFSLIRKYNLYHTRSHGLMDVRIVLAPVSFSVSESRNGFYLLIEDISERYLIENEMRMVSRKLGQILDASDDGFWVYQFDTEMISLSAHILDMLGISAEHELSPISDIIGYIYPDDRNLLLTRLRSIDGQENNSISLEIRIKNPEGGWNWVYFRGKITEWDHEGKPLSLAGAVTDITRRKESEQKLLESEAFNRSLVSNLPDYLLVFSMDGTILYLNESACRKMGGMYGEIVGKNITDYVVPEMHSVIQTQIRRRMDGESLEPYEIQVVRDDATVIDTEVQATVIMYDGKPAILAVLTDITERKENEIELARYAETLKGTIDALASANSKLNLLSNVTRHDILNQIHIVMSYLALLQESDLSPGDDHILKKIAYAVGFIQRHIEFSRNYQEIGVHTPVWQSPHTIILSLDAQGRTITSDLESLEIYADPLLPKVFENLLDNALRHGSHVTRITVHKEVQDNGSLFLVWEDDGTGIQEDDKQRIFDRGFGKNTGLGLFLIREILALTGISIFEGGEPGSGARFCFVIPEEKFRFLQDEDQDL